MLIYDIAVVGAGPAGSMAALRASQLKKNVIMIERNDVIGRKILLTGNGRCNITNTAPIEVFIRSFGEQGRFLKPAFFAFCNNKLVDFFNAYGLDFKTEGLGRVFPVTDQAASVVHVLRKCLADHKVTVLFRARVVRVERNDDVFQLQITGGHNTNICARRVIVATGGISYKETGSSGDGFRIAQALGHTVVDLRPALVPLRIQEPWIKQLQGLSLKDVCISVKYGNRTIVSPRGELMFTHFGVSGPLVLDVSSTVVSALREHETVVLSIDFIPEIGHEELNAGLLSECAHREKLQVKSIIRHFLSQRMVSVFLQVLDIDVRKRAHHITKNERLRIAERLKRFSLTVTGPLSLERAMVTNGGIATEEINAKTMESRVVPGLYFAGEIIEGCGKSGGFNLQQAFSTGYLAGEKASA